MTDDSSRSTPSRWIARLFPSTPDFYALLIEQCETVVQGSSALVDFMQSGSAADSDRVRDLEHAGDRIKQRNLDVLHRAFATPMDREDIFRAISAIDNVLNYAKTTVREMHVLGLPPDEHTLAMAKLLQEGSEALLSGFSALKKHPDESEKFAERARKTERRTEKIYRSAVAELFDAAHYAATLTDAHRADAEALDVLLSSLNTPQRQAVSGGVAFVLEILKRREVYRHMSNAADRVAQAGEVLHDIVVKAS